MTQWSLVKRAGCDGEAASEALGALLNRYLPALRSHLVIRQQLEPERADDLLQAFLTDKVLEERIMAKADQARGRFRTFLLTALDRFVIDENRYQTAGKRGGAEPDRDLEDALDVACPGDRPDRAFDLAWARQILADAELRMRDECRRSGREDIWGVFEARVLRPALDGTAPVAYDILARQYCFRSPAEASNVMITSKRAFVRHLRAVVAEYAGDEAETEAEIHDLYRILSGGRAG
jgi:RNA polymerase sigma-70 factor (ECF subfamily)